MGPASKQRARVRNGGAALTIRRFMPVGPVPAPPPRLWPMIVSIHKTKEAVSKAGSYEVRFSDGRKSVYFHYDDEPSRRLRPEQMTSEQALEAAKTFARTERDR
jgi:hypothetical protein